VSSAAQANPSDQKLQAQVQTLFRGETLRGLLLYAWGWSLVGTIAFWVAGAAAAAVWLCSDAASFITGATLHIDGGKLAGNAPFSWNLANQGADR